MLWKVKGGIMGVMEDSKKKKVMEHREEVRYEVSNQFQLSKSDPLVRL